MSTLADPANSILVAADGSPAAEAAAEVAIQLAQSQSLLVRGLYVVEGALVLNTYTNYYPELHRSDEPGSRAELVTWFEQAGDRALRWLEWRCQAANVPVTTQILFGGVSDLIRQEADQSQMLALGRRGHSHAAEPDHLGSKFRSVAHHTGRPLLIGGEAGQWQLQRLLLAYNGSEHSQNALSWAARLQRALSAEVVVLFVAENDDTTGQKAEQIQQQLAQSNLANYRWLTRPGQPAAEIVAAATEIEAGLIVMGGYHHPFLLEWLVGSTLDEVLAHTSLPLLVA
jgi:nucleotide-binding universal stress UspA family protein